MFLSLHSSALNARNPTGAATSPHGKAPTPVNAPAMAAHTPKAAASPVKMAGSRLVASREKYRSSIMPSLTTVHGWQGTIGGNTTGGAGKRRVSLQIGGHHSETKRRGVRKSFKQHWTSLFPGQNPRWNFPPLHDTRLLSKQAPPFRHDFWTQHLMLFGSWGQAPVTKNPIFLSLGPHRCFGDRKAMQGARFFFTVA